MSKKNKALRGFLHHHPDATVEQAWDAAWLHQQTQFASKAHQEKDDRIKELEKRVEELEEALWGAYQNSNVSNNYHTWAASLLGGGE